MPPTGPAPRPLLFLVPDLLGPPGGIARYSGMVAQALVAKGVPLHIIALHDKPSDTPHPFASYGACGSSRVKFVQTFISQFLWIRPAIVVVGHCHFAPLVAWVCKATRTPYVVFLYGIEVWERLSDSRRWAIAGATRRIAISHHTARQAATINGWDVNGIEILYNCLDPKLAFPAPRSISANSPSILTVSRLSQEDSYKGLDVVLKAMPRLLAEFPTLTYHIVGDGNARTDLEQWAQQLNIAQAVRFHGRVSDESLRGLYAQSTVYVMPSRNEGFGFVFLEAMAQSTPAIGGTMDATPEVIEDGVTGFTVDPHSSDAVAEATATLLRDSTLRTQMGQAAWHRAHNTFGFAKFQTRLWELLGFEEITEGNTLAKSLL
jgi:phosphatidylinositol alpha-1,6-mannosyltransferase